MPPMDYQTAILAIAILFISYAGFIVGFSRHVQLPPGPKGVPILGAALEHPKTEFWKTYAEWGRKYGNKGIISFHVLGRRMVVLNSTKAADDLFAKRSGNFSDRPFPAMAGTLMKREKSMFYISYNERLKTYRKLLQQSFNPSASQAYWDVLEHEALVLSDSLIATPERLVEHLRRNAAAVIMKIAFGYQVTEDNDHFVALAEESMRVGSLAGAPGKWLVDSLPILRYLPDWAPGASFKKQAKAWSHQLYTQSLEPHNYVKEQLAAGRAFPSFTSKLLQPVDGSTPDADYEDIILWTAGALYAAGADTTVSSVKTFFFTMMLHPEIQKKAQQEVDAVVSREGRLPKLTDRSSMPYLESILKEVLRWAPASPIGIFHANTVDDVYEGYFIPAKSTIIGNIWAMMHDESVYPDPFTFNPDRFLEGNGRSPQADPREYVFGFGRRVCPGQHVGEASIFIQMALVLATVTITKPLDESGKVIEPEIGFTTAIVRYGILKLWDT